MTRATIPAARKRNTLFLLFLLVCAVPTYAFERHSFSQRVSLSEHAPKQASSTPKDHAWKLGLLGLAVVSFLIRKRL